MALVWFLVAQSFVVVSCAYRLSNIHARNPKGIKSIAVEGVYDSSQVPFPHDVVWRNLQHAVASSGHVRLTSIANADALLRIHIESASLSPSGPTQDVSPKKEPKIEDSGQNPPSYSAYESLGNARALYPDSTATLTVTAEVWNLSTKKLILQRSYPLSSAFRAFRGDMNANTNLKSNFAQYQEALNSAYSKMGRDLANRIITDLLIQ